MVVWTAARALQHGAAMQQWALQTRAMQHSMQRSETAKLVQGPLSPVSMLNRRNSGGSIADRAAQ